MRARNQRRAPTVKKRSGSPFYWYEFSVGNVPHRKSTEETNQVKAQAICDQAFAAALLAGEQRRKTGREPMTIGDAAPYWWKTVGATLNEDDLGPYSLDPEFARRPINWLVRNLGPAKFLHAITDRDVIDLITLRRADMVVDGRDARGKPIYRPVSARTVNRTVTKLLRRIMLKARDQWDVHITKMPKWDDLLLEEKKKLPRILKVKDQATLDGAERPELTAARVFAVMTGLRLAEVVGVLWGQVDLRNGVLYVIQKGGNAREVIIDPPLAALLRSMEGPRGDADPVFTFIAKRTTTNPRNGQEYVRGERYPLTYWGLTSARRRDWTKAGIKANFHDLRRTAAMDMYRATGRIEDAQALLAHADPETTKLYLNVKRTDADLRAIHAARNEHVAKQWAEANATADVPAMHRQIKQRKRGA